MPVLPSAPVKRAPSMSWYRTYPSHSWLSYHLCCFSTWLAVSSPASCQCLFSGEFQQSPAIAESILKIRVYHCWSSGWVTRSLSQDCFLKPGLYFSFWEIIELHHSSLVILFCDFSLKVSEFFVAVWGCLHNRAGGWTLMQILLCDTSCI